MNITKKQYEKLKRKCLRCRKKFNSTWAGNRICYKCKKSEQYFRIKINDNANENGKRALSEKKYMKIFSYIFLFIFSTTNLFAEFNHKSERNKYLVEGIEEYLQTELRTRYGARIDVSDKELGLTPRYLKKIMRYMNQKNFEDIIIKTVNKYNLHDKKVAYIWYFGNINYPEPFEYNELIKTDLKYIFYSKKDIYYYEKKYVDNIKYEYYYKNLLCLEKYEIGENENQKEDNINMLNDFLNNKQNIRQR